MKKTHITFIVGLILCVAGVLGWGYQIMNGWNHRFEQPLFMGALHGNL